MLVEINPAREEETCEEEFLGDTNAGRGRRGGEDLCCVGGGEDGDFERRGRGGRGGRGVEEGG